MRTPILMILAMLAASVIPVQAVVNGRLGQEIQNPLLAALISFLGGTLILGILVFVTAGGHPKIPDDASLPWYLYTGGLLGAVLVTVVLILVPKIGAANVIAAAVAGQLLTALIIDHFALLGVPQVSVTAVKLGGCGLLLLGTVLIQRG